MSRSTIPVARKTAYVESDGTAVNLSRSVGSRLEPWLGCRCLPMRVREAEMAMALGPVAAGNRDVELGIAPHAVLGDVEAGRLDVRLDANPPEPVQRPERAVRGCEREAAHREEAERLHAELVRRAGVEEAAATDADRGRQRRKRE